MTNQFPSDITNISIAKLATIKAFNENFNYQDVSENPAKEALDVDEVLLTTYSCFGSDWLAETHSIFSDEIYFEIESTDGNVEVTVCQIIQTTSTTESSLIEGATIA